jgi:hypothetical protein
MPTFFVTVDDFEPAISAEQLAPAFLAERRPETLEVGSEKPDIAAHHAQTRNLPALDPKIDGPRTHAEKSSRLPDVPRMVVSGLGAVVWHRALRRSTQKWAGFVPSRDQNASVACCWRSFLPRVDVYGFRSFRWTRDFLVLAISSASFFSSGNASLYSLDRSLLRRFPTA